MGVPATCSVSVVIPVHNGEKYIEEALRSVRAQTTPAEQVIVVDDGSTDATARIVAAFSDVEYFQQEKSGPGAARNLGISHASGDYIALLDADDLWLPRKLELQLAASKDNPQAQLFFGLTEQFISEDLSPEERENLVVSTEAVPGYIPSNFFVSKENFSKVGSFETGWAVGEFISWYLRGVEADFSSFMVPEVLTRRRVHTTNMGISRRDARSDYVRIVKASLERRRARAAEQNS